MMRYGWGGVGLFGGWLASAIMGLLMVALFVALIVAVVRLARHGGGHGYYARHDGPAGTAGEQNGALKILDERFAKGDINEEEYTRKKELILKKPS